MVLYNEHSKPEEKELQFGSGKNLEHLKMLTSVYLLKNFNFDGAGKKKKKKFELKLFLL